MDDEFCKQRAKAVRDLADKADPFIKKRLLELAKHYERRVTGAKETEASPSSSQNNRNESDQKTTPVRGWMTGVVRGG